MNSYKVNSRLLSRFNSLISQTQRYLSAPAEVEIDESDKKLFESYIKPKVEKIEEDDVKFPPIIDNSEIGKEQRKRQRWFDKIRQLGIVEEKIFELNMPKYYGWKINKIEEGVLPYDPLPQAQYITRTHLANTVNLPKYYDSVLSAEELNSLVEKIKNQVKDALVFEFYYRNRDHEYNSEQLNDKCFMDNVLAKNVSQQINSILISNLCPTNVHLIDTQIDIEPRIEAFWAFGGLEQPEKYKKFNQFCNPRIHRRYPERLNQYMKYIGKPILHLRHNLPLKEIISLKDSEDEKLDIPINKFDLRKMGYFQSRERATIIPGFWPGDYSEFGFLSYHSIGHLKNRPEQFNDNVDAIIAQAIFGSYSWLYTQACYQGFSTFQDPTYPLVNQMILTNGQLWNFCVYQLNTTTMHQDCIQTNPRKNICWVTDSMKLFDRIENGEVKGFNEDVLRNLIKFYANVPQIKEGVNMKPYLEKEKLIANIEDSERRIWLEEQYKHLLSNRPRHKLPPEQYHYQWIYVRKFNHFLPWYRKSPYDKGINVYNRKLDDHTPKYIPRCLRTNRKLKWGKTFYPEIEKKTPKLTKNPIFTLW
ncbi:PREDICTED: 28S ribosomal protein S30, mitochondrial [Ceratosolen solmsi marchali]|uniref:28S ribosomal protein S30, mitochondrial n=1 Tax=Ceratosolen solmsi marchali TaxID=326594 RepID=A0AAJ7DYK0_9HYME|nr:PREDICTED: 28S ribosomal protein S30, mitochondrial [Ceratosolen solmsi marchali]